jgi:hypothetical protein
MRRAARPPALASRRLFGVAALGARRRLLGHRGAAARARHTVALWLAVAVTAVLGALWASAARDAVAAWQSCPVCFAVRPRYERSTRTPGAGTVSRSTRCIEPGLPATAARAFFEDPRGAAAAPARSAWGISA